MARRQRRYTAQQWAGLIKEQQDCGDPIDVFCARKQVGTSTFTRWRRRFLDESEASSYNDAQQPRGFVEAVPPSSPMISLVLGNGVRLELPVALGSEKIAELTHAVVNHERR